MALNLEAIKEKLEVLDNPQKAKKSSGGWVGRDRLWRLDPGNDEISAVIKIVPYKMNLEDPFIHLWFHYGLPGMNSMLCPKKMKNEECEVCDFGWATYNKFKETPEGNEKEELKKALNVLLPNERVHLPVVQIDPDERKEGVKFWGFSNTIYDAIIRHTYEFLNAGIDITDIEKSPEFKVTVISKDKSGKFYNLTNFSEVKDGIKSKISPLADSVVESNKILETCVDIEEIFTFRNPDDVKEALNAYVNSGDEGDESNMGTEKNFESSAPVEGKSAADLSNQLQNMIDKNEDE